MLPYRRHCGVLSLLVLTVYLLFIGPVLCHPGSVESAKEDMQLGELEPKMEMETRSVPGPALARFGINRRNQRSTGFGRKFYPVPRKIPIELEMLVENEEIERPKRFDDYGHMRFGKRNGDEKFDDYGHMRFGR